jgi:hypothetical protein
MLREFSWILKILSMIIFFMPSFFLRGGIFSFFLRPVVDLEYRAPGEGLLPQLGKRASLLGTAAERAEIFTAKKIFS